MKRTIFILLAVLPMIVRAGGAEASGSSFTKGDTLWVNGEWKSVARSEAAYYGVVREVDSVANVATVRYFVPGSGRLRSVQHCVAAGEGKGLRKGKQLYFDAENRVESMEVYTLVRDERTSAVTGKPRNKVRNRIASETYLYPDGKTKEEVVLTYKPAKYGAEGIFYTRKCYYPDGQVQYEETLDEKTTNLTTVYYNEKGKVVKRPKQKFEPYMQMPEFPGGQEALAEFLSANVRYPKVAQQNEIQGRVIVQFVVATDGKIENVEVVRTGGDPSLDKEAVRVIKSMPRWQPGRQRGRPVRVKYTVPVNFRLQ